MRMSSTVSLEISLKSVLFAEKIRAMLGIKSNREPIRGAFADKLREQIAIVRNSRASENVAVNSKPSKESKK